MLANYEVYLSHTATLASVSIYFNKNMTWQVFLAIEELEKG
jgi:hypothetical protein